MINIIICSEDKNFSNTFSSFISSFFKYEGINSNIIVITKYGTDFKNTFKLSNQIYILNHEDKDNSFDSISKQILSTNKDASILIITDKTKNKFFNFLKGSTKFHNNVNLNNNKTINFKDKNTYYSLVLDKILYITTDTNHRQTVIQYENKIYKISKPLNIFMELLDERFIQTHRSCYINKNRLEYMDLTNNTIKFDNNISINYLSRNFKKKF